METLRSARDQDLARGGSSAPNGNRSAGERRASRGVALVWNARRIDFDDAHVLERNVQLVRNELKNRGFSSRAEFNLAKRNDDGSIRVDREPLIDVGIRLRTK